MSDRLQDLLDVISCEFEGLQDQIDGAEEDIMFLEAKLGLAVKALEEINDWDHSQTYAQRQLQIEGDVKWAALIAEKALEKVGK